jgi:phospholipase C
MTETPPPAMPQDKISHIVVLMMENRPFDHLFGFRTGVNGLQGNEFNLLDPSAPQSLSNPAFTVGTGAPYAVTVGKGPGHSVNQTDVQLFGSRNTSGAVNNSGFVAAYRSELNTDKVLSPTNADMDVVMQSFSAAQLPVINALADEFAICDAWHAEVPGPTQPNRLYLHAATSDGHALNNWSATFDLKTIYEQVAAAGFTWATYEEDSNEVREFKRLQPQKAWFKQMSAFAGDCASGALANFVFISPRMLTDEDGHMVNSQHAPHDVRWGEYLIADVYEALRANEDLWKSTLLVVVYDEHGGFYDHVAPPAASNPETPPKTSPTDGDPHYAPTFAFDRLGLRVSAVLVSPWIPKGTVYSRQLQHTSVMKTARDLFGIQASQGNLTNRDAEAAIFSDVFSLAVARTDAPMTLTRPALPDAPPPTDASHPANQPLDPLQQGILLGTHHRTRHNHPTETAELLPNTQGEASKFVKARNREL